MPLNFDLNDEHTIMSRYGFTLIRSSMTGRTLLTAPMLASNAIGFIVIEAFDTYEDAFSFALAMHDLGLTPQHFTDGRMPDDDDDPPIQEEPPEPPRAITATRNGLRLAPDLRVIGGYHG